jgi:branched-chain amino acid transport system ATP-binding protein
MLIVKNITKKFGGLRAVDDVSFEVREGSITGLIGPNGSGKTTLFNLISGIFKPTSGEILLDGEIISNKPAFKIAAMGLSRTFQVVKPFNNISVFENVLVGAYIHHGNRSLAEQKTSEVLDRLDLGKYSGYLMKSLPLAMKKKVEIARAVATDPKILLLDEVMGGLNPQETDYLLKEIQFINSTGITIIIIEHKMKCIMSLAERILVLDSGALISDGRPREVCQDVDVIKAYLGDDFCVED